MTAETSLLEGKYIRGEIARRLDSYTREKIPIARQSEYEALPDGWVLDKALKKQVWMRKPKTHDAKFEDLVWAMCARLGFTSLSRDRALRIPYGKLENEKKQVDVLAADDEVVLVIECKSSKAEQAPTHAYKTEIESIQGYRAGLIGAIREQFPNHKVKFIFATNNINVSKETLSRIESADIAHLDEEAVDYYHELATHLGSAAKFQLLGNVFHGQKISAMDSTVPAIQGKMGGYTYYSFAIEPARLLKVAYVLHRTKANTRWMPTYQRIIKKSRLKKVTSFIENGGFFPNSLIVNIDNDGKRLRFDRVPSQSGTTVVGTLHLPPKYRSAYIIDGQHRLYGYAHSQRASTELVPVVAFVDMDRAKQLEMFMDINENQQSVPKNLRLTLKADLEWESTDKRKQAQALKLKVAQLLGELKSSPLRGRVLIGEEKPTDRLCISLAAISQGVARGRFIGDFSSTEMRKPGSFYRGSSDTTLEPLTDFLELCFGYLRDELPNQWNIGRGEGGFVFTNAGTEASLRLIGDIVDHLTLQGKLDPRAQSPKEVFAQVRPLLGHLVAYLDGLTADEVSGFRQWFGSGGPVKYLHQFQSALVEANPGFSPEGFADWKANQEKQFNAESYTMVHEIEVFLNQDIKHRLEDKYKANWFRDAVPKSVYQAASTKAAEKQYDADPGVQVDWWDCLYVIDYQKILLKGGQSVWVELFDKTYTLPSDRKAGSWREKASWISELNKIRNKVSHNDTVLEDEYEFLQLLHSHFDLGGSGRDS